MAGIIVFLAGSAASGCSVSTTMLIVSRIVQGAGGALMIPGSLSLISATIEERERGKAIGTWSSLTTVVTVGGPILGGALADAGLWRDIFFINIPLGVTALLILWRKVPESRGQVGSGTLDWPGAAAIAIALALLTLGFLRIPLAGWRNWSVAAAVGAGVLLLGLFVRIEGRSKDPMMPLTLFRNPVFSGVNGLTFFLYAGLGTAMLFLSLELVQAQGFSQLEAGLSFLPFTILMISLSRYAGALADKYGPRSMLITGPLVAGAGMVWLSKLGQLRGIRDYWTGFFPGMLLFGLGMAITVVPLTATVMGAVGRQFSGVASGVNNALSRVAGVFANAVLGAMAVLLFTGVVRRGVEGMPLDQQAKEAVVSQAANLGDAKAAVALKNADGRGGVTGEGVKGEAASGVTKQVQQLYREAFIGVCAIMLRISAGLAFVGALVAFLFVKRGRVD
jgi:MFS family permease